MMMDGYDKNLTDHDYGYDDTLSAIFLDYDLMISIMMSMMTMMTMITMMPRH
jgi:hypothetical protein